ncbi:ABC transporter ATP-binding protein [Nocardia sp. NPDC051321]|uniref:ABC transporter ATP-binding protein n=1 Tax=Nocardia sp. NPDC051321 TaxID=3364323 RepID=UPI0037BBC8D0
MDTVTMLRMLDPDQPRASGQLTLRVIGFITGLAWRADRRALIACLAAGLAQSALTSLMLLVARSAAATLLADAGGSGAGAGRLMMPAVLIAAAIVANLVLASVSGYYQTLLMEKVTLAAMARVLAAATAADLLAYDDPGFYDLLTRTREAAGVHPGLMLRALLAAAHTLIYTAAIAATVVAMAWFTTPFLLLALLPVWAAGRRANRDWHQLMSSQAEIWRTTVHLEQMLTGRDHAAEIRAFGAGGEMLRRWRRIRADLLAQQTRLNRVNAIRALRARGLSQAITMVMAAVLSALAYTGALPIATALTVLAAIQLLSGQFRNIGTLLSTVGKGRLFIADIIAFTHRPSSVSTPPPPRPFTTLTTHRVGFTYPDAQTPALTDIDIELRAGEVVALVGYNGSGKTTLTKILAGLYPATTGQLHRDGILVTERELAELQASTTVLLQHPNRYPLSATDNIALGDPRPDPARITAAATHAGIADQLAALDHGYDTPLSKERTHGIDLSGGQWQKIALARAFYRDTPLIILDEPTTALDPRAEADLYDHIRLLFTDHTIVLVTHRLASVRHADRIYVLDHGHITETGTHQQLMNLHGTYAELFNLQAAAYHDHQPAQESAAGRTLRDR